MRDMTIAYNFAESHACSLASVHKFDGVARLKNGRPRLSPTGVDGVPMSDDFD